jgi:hypothetical protein
MLHTRPDFLAQPFLLVCLSLQVPDISVKDSQKNLKKSLEKGILKILSKMGISLLGCYHGAQVTSPYYCRCICTARTCLCACRCVLMNDSSMWTGLRKPTYAVQQQPNSKLASV